MDYNHFALSVKNHKSPKTELQSCLKRDEAFMKETAFLNLKKRIPKVLAVRINICTFAARKEHCVLT